MSQKPTTIDHAELLERKANVARRRLMDTVDELDARKNEGEHEIERDVSLVPIAAGAVAALVLMTWAGSHVRRWNERRRRRAAFRRLLRALHLR